MKVPVIGRVIHRFNKLSRAAKIIIVVVLIGLAWLGYKAVFGKTKSQTQYQTSQVTRGTLIVTVTGSGQISTANNSSISTNATGVVSKLYVKDGDTVKAGDPIADIDLDLQGKQQADQALASYQSAQNNLNSAKATLYSTQSTMFTNWQKFYDLATNSTYQNADGSPNNGNRVLTEFNISQDNWLASEAQYKNQQNVVNQAQTSLSAAWLSYQQSSPTIYAPISGTVSGLSLQVGSVISATINNTNNAQVSTKIASIRTDANPAVSINLTEIDIPSVKIGNRATVTLDAFPNMTFTGKVLSIDTGGTTSSGVTNYPTVIQLDTNNTGLLPNMNASANIITATRDNVLMVPTAAVQNQNGTTFVRVLKNGKISQVEVTPGLSSDTETEISSGLTEGETVVTSITQTATMTGSTTASPFSGGFGGARNVRIGGGIGR